MNHSNSSQDDNTPLNTSEDSTPLNDSTPHNLHTPPPPKAKAKSPKLIILLIILGLIAWVVWGLVRDKQQTNNAPTVIQGQIEVEQIPVASKVAGRVMTISVKESDNVAGNDPLINMSTPEIDAKIEEAQAATEAAQSQLTKAKNGARPQELAQAKYQYEAAQAAADLAKVSFERIDRLAKEGLMAQQKRDEAYTNYIASSKKADMAFSQYDMVKTGAREEDINAATAQVKQAQGKLKEALTDKEEANLKSPVAGIVDSVIVKTGQVVGQGVPLLTVVDPNDQHLVLNVTEDKLHTFSVGSQFVGNVPALSTAKQPYRQNFTVYEISVLSDFATWRPTNSEDGFDMRTFEVLARPQTPDIKLKQGMSVVVELPADTTSTNN